MHEESVYTVVESCNAKCCDLKMLCTRRKKSSMSSNQEGVELRSFRESRWKESYGGTRAGDEGEENEEVEEIEEGTKRSDGRGSYGQALRSYVCACAFVGPTLLGRVRGKEPERHEAQKNETGKCER